MLKMLTSAHDLNSKKVPSNTITIYQNHGFVINDGVFQGTKTRCFSQQLCLNKPPPSSSDDAEQQQIQETAGKEKFHCQAGKQSVVIRMMGILQQGRRRRILGWILRLWKLSMFLNHFCLSAASESVRPIIGILKNKTAFKPTPNPGEVDEVLDAPLEMFIKDENRRAEESEWMSDKYLIHSFDYESENKKYLIWGLTAGILIRAASVVYQKPPAFTEQNPKFKFPGVVNKDTVIC